MNCSPASARAAEAVELTQGHLGLASCLPFLPAPIQKVLGGAGVEQLVGWNACDHHDFLGAKFGNPLKRHTKDG